MEFLAHRGLWTKLEEKNTIEALFKALDAGYGLETDIRDLDGSLVISHDMPSSRNAVPLEILFQYYHHQRYAATLALNIKSDGLQAPLVSLIREYGISNYFVFDMSVPDTLGYLRQGIPTFIRRSDLEHHPRLLGKAQGVWLDELLDTWVNADVIKQEAQGTHTLCIVSSELHGRPYEPQWDAIKNALNAGTPCEKIVLCTDVPQIAERFFT